ncbi:MAG: long-chain-acyl-CoA synthetase [Pseudomonadota bacterium]
MGAVTDLRMDWRALTGLRRTVKAIGDLDPESYQLIPDDLEASVDKHGANVAFRFEGTLMTYDEFESIANRVAHWALAQGFEAGDVVALFMENRPEYVATWFGLSKVGIVTALINNNLSDEALAHCVNIADAKAVISGADQDDAMASTIDLFKDDPALWTWGGTETNRVRALEPVLAEQSPERPDRSHRDGIKAAELALYVYTSGTTGLPKAARLTHTRTQGMSRTFIGPCRITQRDRVYITLPLYHGTGGICGVGIALNTGASIILRRKFSASQFWDDAADEGATSFAYIGELCRYLLNQPPHPKEQAHRLRTGFGNGLRPEIWEDFFKRFNIPHLAEFYGSTEGNVSFVNVDGKVGAVGRIPPFLKSRFEHIKFVKFDIETEEPVRAPNGLCIECEDDEPGEAIGLIGDDVRQRFEGYNDAEATKKKILRDVFEPGDMWFRTGDLMRKDAKGWVYFIDRIGDTFRWKGENVATNEVGEVLSQFSGIEHANVYGVPVPGTDGKAGMAAITAPGDIDWDALHSFLAERLPAYARPLFLRVQPEAETTGTFKYRKVDLVKEGFNPGAVPDPVYFAHPELGRFVPMTQEHYDTILAGGFKF